MDPLTVDYAWLTPYQFASNRPIEGIDLDGLEFVSKAAEDAYHHRNPALSLPTPAPRPTSVAPSSIPSPSSTDHPVTQSRKSAEVGAFLTIHNSPANVAARASANSTASVRQPPPAKPANEFEAGAVQGVQMAAVGYAATLCPTCFVAAGSAQVYNGVKNDDPGLILTGGLNIAGGVMGRLGGGKVETYYRAMEAEDYAIFQKTGKMPASSETFISPTAAYASKYKGVLVEINTKVGTFDQLKSIGVRDAQHPMTADLNLPSMPEGGWTSTNAFFKQEKGQINIGLGQGKALETFNKNIQSFKQIKKQ